MDYSYMSSLCMCKISVNPIPVVSSEPCRIEHGLTELIGNANLIIKILYLIRLAVIIRVAIQLSNPSPGKNLYSVRLQIFETISRTRNPRLLLSNVDCRQTTKYSP